MTIVQTLNGRLSADEIKYFTEKSLKVNLLFFSILNNRKKLLANGKKWQIETCDQGMQNCVRAVQSVHSQECHLVSSENYKFLNLENSLRQEIFEELRVLAQKWIGDELELAGTPVYGIRKYGRGAFLLGHLDHLK